MTDLTKEMQKIIEENLPAATAGVMKSYIEEAEVTKQNLAEADKTIEAQIKNITLKEDEIRALKRELEGAKNQLQEQDELKSAQEALSIRERDLQLEIANIRLQSADDRNATVERLVDRVFGHPSVTVSTYKDVMVPIEGGNGCSGYAHKENGVTESQTTTQSKS